MTLTALSIPTTVPEHRFDTVTMALHWTTLVLIIGLFATAWSLHAAADGDTAKLLLTTHRSLGAAIWIVTCYRLTWRCGFAARPGLLDTMPAFQRLAARANEYGLYGLLLLQPLTGLGQSLTRGRPFQLLLFEVPKLMARDKASTAFLHQVHGVTAWLLLVLIGLHACAALFHRFVLKDQVLQSMLPVLTFEPRAGEENFGRRE